MRDEACLLAKQVLLGDAVCALHSDRWLRPARCTRENAARHFAGFVLAFRRNATGSPSDRRFGLANPGPELHNFVSALASEIAGAKREESATGFRFGVAWAWRRKELARREGNASRWSVLPMCRYLY